MARRWRSPYVASREDFEHPDPDPPRRRQWRFVVLGLVALIALGAGLWERGAPARIRWCERDWRRSGREAVAALPPDRWPELDWRTATRARGHRFLLPLRAGGHCPANTPTVGYLAHGGGYLAYELSGGP